MTHELVYMHAMQPVLTRAQARSLDRHTIDVVGIPSLVLMESAGRAVAELVSEVLESVSVEDPAVLCIVGPGNNGADAVVAARYLRERSVPTTVVVLEERDKLSPELVSQLQWVNHLGLETLIFYGDETPQRIVELIPEHQVVIDGWFGTGLTRPLSGWRRQVIEILAEAPHRHYQVVAVDVPTGVDADTGQILGAALPAHYTVSFQYPKLGQLLEPGRSVGGELRVVDIGLPGSQLPAVASDVAVVMGEDVLQEAWPIRKSDTHKGSYGRLLVVAGVPDRPGAAYLAGRAALRSGAGVVTIGSSEPTIARLAPQLVELMGLNLGSQRVELEPLQKALDDHGAVVIGPSLEADAQTAALVREALEDRSIPAVLDAGALRALGQDVEWLAKRPTAATVLTPHPGEAAALLARESAQNIQADRVTAVRELAVRSGSVVVLKGATTVIGTPDGHVVLSLGGNPGMATAGTGDVLAGIIGSLLARGVPPTLAAHAGVELHARAGDLAAENLGMESLQASDLISSLSPVLKGVWARS